MAHKVVWLESFKSKFLGLPMLVRMYVIDQIPLKPCIAVDRRGRSL